MLSTESWNCVLYLKMWWGGVNISILETTDTFDVEARYACVNSMYIHLDNLYVGHMNNSCINTT